MFDIDLRTRHGIEHWKRILAHLGLSEKENIDKAELVEFITEFGAQELRKATDDLLASND